MRNIITKALKISFVLAVLYFAIYIPLSWPLVFLSSIGNDKNILPETVALVSNKLLNSNDSSQEKDTNIEPSNNNTVSSSDRLEYFVQNTPFLSDYYFGDTRDYDKNVYLKDSEIFGKVISVLPETKQLKILIPDKNNAKYPIEEVSISYTCQSSNTSIIYGKNILNSDSLVLEDGSLDVFNMIKPGVFIVLSCKNNTCDGDVDWCIVY